MILEQQPMENATFLNNNFKGKYIYILIIATRIYINCQRKALLEDLVEINNLLTQLNLIKNNVSFKHHFTAICEKPSKLT